MAKGMKTGGGSRKGTPNKTTTNFKEAVTAFVNYASPQFVNWLEQIEDPGERFRVVKDLAEYAFPKLARQEVSGVNGGPIEMGLSLTPAERRDALKKLLK